MKSRRDFVQSLFAGTALAGIPAVSEVKASTVISDDVVVIKIDEFMPKDVQAKLRWQWESRFPQTKCVVLGKGMDIEIIKNLK